MHVIIMNYTIPKVFVVDMTDTEFNKFKEHGELMDNEGNLIYSESTCHYMSSTDEIEIEHIETQY